MVNEHRRTAPLPNGVSPVPNGMAGDDAKGKESVVWQCEQRDGFTNYPPDVSERIEIAFLKGEGMIRLKAQKDGHAPKEIFFTEMLQHNPINGNTRTIRRLPALTLQDHVRRRVAEVSFAVRTGKSSRVRLKDYTQQSRTEQLVHEMLLARRDGFEEIEEAPADSCCAKLVQSRWFSFFTLTAVIVNSLWMGLEAELSYDTFNAPLHFEIVAQIFTFIFVAELLIRFGAYKTKHHCLLDAWFCFDGLLVVFMVLETWVLKFVVLVGLIPITSASEMSTKQLAVLRVTQLIRLARVGRVLRMLRRIPEVLILVKGIVVALRSVLFTQFLLLILLYVFAIVFKTQAEYDPDLHEWFPSLGDAMFVLLLQGTLMDEISAPLTLMKEKGAWTLLAAFLIFVFLSSFTILNMLIGILCDVVQEVSTTEKEENAISYLKHTVLEILECYDVEDNGHIDLAAFQLLLQNPELHAILSRFNVEVDDLILMKDMIFPNKETDLSDGPAVVSFADILEAILRLRGGNSTTVKDVVELRRYFSHMHNLVSEKLSCSSQRLERLEQVLEARAPPEDFQKAVLARLEDLARSQEDLQQRFYRFESLVDQGCMGSGPQVKSEDEAQNDKSENVVLE